MTFRIYKVFSKNVESFINKKGNEACVNEFRYPS